MAKKKPNKKNRFTDEEALLRKKKEKLKSVTNRRIRKGEKEAIHSTI